jgi:hypothetical protein
VTEVIAPDIKRYYNGWRSLVLDSERTNLSALSGMSNHLNHKRRTFQSARFSERKRKAGMLALVFILLWSSGISCALCCANEAPDGGSQAERASASRHACCKPATSKARAAFTLTASATATTSCCLMGKHASGPAVLPQTVKHPASVAPIIQSPVEHSADLRLSPVTINAPPLNKGSTYLRGCAFLI